MSLGSSVLVSRSRLALSSPPLSPCRWLPRLAFARSASPSSPCYIWLGLQFAVRENLSTGHGRFVRSLHSHWRLPNQPRTCLAIVSTVIGSTTPSTLQVSSRCAVTATVHSLGWHPTPFTTQAIPTVTPLGYAQLLYCTTLVADVNALGSRVMFAMPHEL